MPKPTKDPNLQEKIRHWVEKNPERWYTAKYEDIRVETGVSVSTLYRYFPLIVAKVADILPSEVKAKREEHIGVSPWRRNSRMKKSQRSTGFSMKDTRIWILLL